MHAFDTTYLNVTCQDVPSSAVPTRLVIARFSSLLELSNPGFLFGRAFLRNSTPDQVTPKPLALFIYSELKLVGAGTHTCKLTRMFRKLREFGLVLRKMIVSENVSHVGLRIFRCKSFDGE